MTSTGREESHQQPNGRETPHSTSTTPRKKKDCLRQGQQSQPWYTRKLGKQSRQCLTSDQLPPSRRSCFTVWSYPHRFIFIKQESYLLLATDGATVFRRK